MPPNKPQLPGSLFPHNLYVVTGEPALSAFRQEYEARFRVLNSLGKVHEIGFENIRELNAFIRGAEFAMQFWDLEIMDTVEP